MIYSKYGRVFKEIRKQKKLTLSDFVEAGLSKTTLSQFENGKQMMGFDKLVEALQTMHVSLEEFELLLNDYAISDHEVMINSLEEAEIYQDTEKLKQLYLEAKSQHYKIFDLVVKGTFCSLNENEIEKIVDFLYDTTIWGCIELSILYFSVDYLKAKEIIFIINNVFQKKGNLFKCPKYRSCFVRTSCRAAAILMVRGYRDSASYLLEKLEVFKVFVDMSEMNLRNLTKGLWVYCFEDRKEGWTEMNKALEVYESLGLKKDAMYYKKRCMYYLSRLEK